MDSAPKEAAWILVQIGHLYWIEAELRKQRAGVALRDAYRSSQSRPVIRRIQQALERWQSTRRFLPQSSIGKAVSYALGQWESLEVYLQDAQIEIDNNLVYTAHGITFYEIVIAGVAAYQVTHPEEVDQAAWISNFEEALAKPLICM
jgi:hypothetical protein